jgi:hypothetical protein
MVGAGSASASRLPAERAVFDPDPKSQEYGVRGPEKERDHRFVARCRYGRHLDENDQVVGVPQPPIRPAHDERGVP